MRAKWLQWLLLDEETTAQEEKNAVSLFRVGRRFACVA